MKEDTPPLTEPQVEQVLEATRERYAVIRKDALKFFLGGLALGLLAAGGITILGLRQIAHDAAQDAVKGTAIREAEERVERAASEALAQFSQLEGNVDEEALAASAQIAAGVADVSVAATEVADIRGAASVAESEIEELENQLRQALDQNRLEATYGNPVEWNPRAGSDNCSRLTDCCSNGTQYVADSMGLVVLYNGGDEFGQAVGGVCGSNGQRAFYWSGQLGTLRGVSHVLPAQQGETFWVWGNPRNISIEFWPISIRVN